MTDLRTTILRALERTDIERLATQADVEQLTDELVEALDRPLSVTAEDERLRANAAENIRRGYGSLPFASSHLTLELLDRLAELGAPERRPLPPVVMRSSDYDRLRAAGSLVPPADGRGIFAIPDEFYDQIQRNTPYPTYEGPLAAAEEPPLGERLRSERLRRKDGGAS